MNKLIVWSFSVDNEDEAFAFNVQALNVDDAFDKAKIQYHEMKQKAFSNLENAIKLG